ncbi:hypothetical protein [Paraflavitalea pollutisoli]|uniref:hypothetical protein n=1 Tax=Paraflavitalea pollutisoli TaxID=3034143 RepID=UPI0023EB19E7|nr:hypothetical protein [Paraflavitalea sp. H1-2-19X]
MKKEIVDYIGCLLFGNQDTAGTGGQLHLHSEKQFRVGADGRLENAASVLTDITVDQQTIYLHYVLPDGSVARFANAVKQVDCTLNADYTIGSIVYEAEPLQGASTGGEPGSLLFTLQCEEDVVRFYEDQRGKAGYANRVLFEIC